MPKPPMMRPSALHVKTTTDAPKCFLHAKTTTDAPKCFLHAKTTTNVPGSNSPLPLTAWGLTKRQGKGGEERGGDWGVWWKYIENRVKMELNYMKGEK
jgi:hypothetical protein